MRKGFTLVEVLTTIAIISILAVVITVVVLSQRAKARDYQRKDDIKKIQAALEDYYESKGYYPGASHGPGNIPQSFPISDLDAQLIAYFPNGVPDDPVSSKHYTYYVNNDKPKHYILAATMEKDKDIGQGDGGNCAAYYEVSDDFDYVSNPKWIKPCPVFPPW